MYRAQEQEILLWCEGAKEMSKAINILQAALQRAMAGRPKVGGFPYLAEIAKRLAARQPAAHRAAIGVVARAKCGAEMRLFVEDDKQMREEKPRQREKQNGGRLFVEAEA